MLDGDARREREHFFVSFLLKGSDGFKFERPRDRSHVRLVRVNRSRGDFFKRNESGKRDRDG